MSYALSTLGCMPKKEMLEHRDPMILALRFGGAVISSTCSELCTRTFALQRLKNIFDQKFRSDVPLLKIEPEMDTVMRSMFVLGPYMIFLWALFILMAMPAEATWPQDPLVWVGLLLKLFSCLVVDALVIAANRSLNQIKGETWLQTRARLQSPFQHWAQRQCDLGEHFQRAKSAAEGTPADAEKEVRPSTLDKIQLALQSTKWSNHRYWTDSRVALLLVGGIAPNFMGTGATAMFGMCGLWYSYRDHYCLANPGH